MVYMSIIATFAVLIAYADAAYYLAEPDVQRCFVDKVVSNYVSNRQQ